MAKEAIKKIKLQVVGGKATAAPPLGPALGQAGINIGEFVNQFNAATKDRMDEVVPVVISLFEDRSFSFVTKTSPASRMILKAIGEKKGSGKNMVKRVGTITKAQVREIAQAKLEDLSANDVDQAMKIIEGTAKSMGVEVK
ncbi:50S ribosomal protein L11 [Patescibacteria group bacterium]|nr:50S ribosomal protein L11 [Patescibacteria group bacterium]